jgi:hypothetical protein
MPPLPPGFSSERIERLDDLTRQSIRDWYHSDTTQLVLSLVENTHPGRNLPSMLPKSEADKDAAVCLLNRVRGWETYRNTLLTLLDQRPAGGDVEETYTSE